MTNAQQAEIIFREAVESFPYPVEFTSIAQGDFEGDVDQEIEYGEEFTFEVGKLFDETLLAGGWIEYRQSDGEVTISGFFVIARNGDWENGSILREHEALQTYYDFRKKTWDLNIDTY